MLGVEFEQGRDVENGKILSGRELLRRTMPVAVENTSDKGLARDEREELPERGGKGMVSEKVYEAQMFSPRVLSIHSSGSSSLSSSPSTCSRLESPSGP